MEEPMPRKSTTYRNFSRECFNILRRFKEQGTVHIPMPDKRRARNARFEMYRFFGYLRNAEPGDPIAPELDKIARTCTMTIDTREDGSVFLTLTPNPMITALGPTDQHDLTLWLADLVSPPKP
jgi:hypothetical protein